MAAAASGAARVRTRFVNRRSRFWLELLARRLRSPPRCAARDRAAGSPDALGRRRASSTWHRGAPPGTPRVARSSRQARRDDLGADDDQGDKMSKRFLAFVVGLLALTLAVGATTAAADTPPGIQTADQTATSGQQAGAASGATQVKPSNTNISIRVLSDGNDGNVTQTNAVDSTAKATNSNDTTQDASQTQGRAGGIQTSNQSAENGQLAGAVSQALQFAPSNTNVDIRVGSDGNGGSVTQANTASSDASAKNDNDTTQNADQSQAGGSSPCGCDSAPAVQTSDQSAESEQKAIALSAAEQKDAKNVNLPIRVGS